MHSITHPLPPLYFQPLYRSDTDADFSDLLSDVLASQHGPNDDAASQPTPFPEQIRQLKQAHAELQQGGLDDTLGKFYSSAQAGVASLLRHDLPGALAHFDAAALQNSSQPLVQRGISLYLMGRYEEAAEQLQRDVDKLERRKLFRAADMRLWLCAALNRLGREKEALAALGLRQYAADGTLVVEPRFLLRNVLSFFGGEIDLSSILAIIGRVDESDATGTIYYGNFYLGFVSPSSVLFIPSLVIFTLPHIRAYPPPPPASLAWSECTLTPRAMPTWPVPF